MVLHATYEVCVAIEPAVRMPDTAFAWRVNAPPELNAIISFAREAASWLYTA